MNLEENLKGLLMLWGGLLIVAGCAMYLFIKWVRNDKW